MIIIVAENTQIKQVWDGTKIAELCANFDQSASLNASVTVEIELATQAYLDLELDLTNFSCGTNLALVLKFKLMGPGASVKFMSRAVLRDQQVFKIVTEQQHLAPYTTSDLLLKTVCFNQAQWSYHGKIFVAPAGKGTVASQINRNLLVADMHAVAPESDTGPQAFSIPALEVLTNDVCCTHGSAVGQVDQASLQYLLSRGLTPAVAELVLLESFLG